MNFDDVRVFDERSFPLYLDRIRGLDRIVVRVNGSRVQALTDRVKNMAASLAEITGCEADG